MVLRWSIWKNYDVLKAKIKTDAHWMHLFIWYEKKKNWAKNHQWRLLHKFRNFWKTQDLKAASNVLVTFVNEAPDTHCYVVIFLNRKIHCLIYSPLQKSSLCYKLWQRLRVTCSIAGQYNTKSHGTITVVIFIQFRKAA